MDRYDSKSCNALEKPSYSPVEAAIRWCGLISEEANILGTLIAGEVPKTGQFPRWPCLQANCEKIIDAMINGGLPYGRNGMTVRDGDQVTPSKRTVRHADLREWMVKNWPDQKPAFLFDEIERKTHAAINADSFLSLQADRDSLKARIEKAEAWAKGIMAEKSALLKERDSLLAKVAQANIPDERSETTYLNIISALLACIAGELPSVVKHPSFSSEAKLIEAIDSHYKGFMGLSQSNLTRKFPKAKITTSSR